MNDLGQVTGYDSTNESQGFSTKEFLSKWDFTVHELYLYGMFLILPLGIAGLIFSFRRSVRLGLMLTLWFLPGTLLYNSYYWGHEAAGVGFLRFFLTLFPPLIVAAMWLMRNANLGAIATDGIPIQKRWQGSIATPIGAGFLTAATAALGLWITLPHMERQHRGNMNLAYSAQRVMAKIKSLLRSIMRPSDLDICAAGLIPCSRNTPIVS